MKTRKAILADKITIEQTIQDIEAKNQNGTWSQTADGSLAASVPIRPADMKQQAAVRIRLEAIDARLGVSKSRTNKSAIMADGASFAPTPDLLTEQMRGTAPHHAYSAGGLIRGGRLISRSAARCSTDLKTSANTRRRTSSRPGQTPDFTVGSCVQIQAVPKKFKRLACGLKPTSKPLISLGFFFRVLGPDRVATETL